MANPSVVGSEWIPDKINNSDHEDKRCEDGEVRRNHRGKDHHKGREHIVESDVTHALNHSLSAVTVSAGMAPNEPSPCKSSRVIAMDVQST